MKQLTSAQISEAKDLVLEAQTKMREASQLLRQYVRLTDDRHTSAYIVDHLEIMTSEDHVFVSRDANLDDVLKELDNQEIGQEEEEDEDDEEAFASLSPSQRALYGKLYE